MNGIVPEIEVGNDLINAVLNKHPNGEQAWIQKIPPSAAAHGPQVVALEKLLAWAHEADTQKHMKFLLGVDDEKKIDTFLAEKQNFGFMPDVIELEEKVHYGIHPNDLYELLDRLNKYHTPIYLYVRVPINDTNKPFEQTVEKAVSIYQIAYSSSNVSGIIWNGLIDHPGNQVDAPGLLKSDGSPKQIYSALEDLIHKEWWTNKTDTTDDTGSISIPAFFGDYLISAKNSNGQIISKQINFSKRKSRKQTILVRI